MIFADLAFVAVIVIVGVVFVYSLFFNIDAKVTKPEKTVRPPSKNKPKPKAVTEDAEIAALVAADLKMATKGMPSDTRTVHATSLEQLRKEHARAAAKANAAASKPVHKTELDEMVEREQGFIPVPVKDKREKRQKKRKDDDFDPNKEMDRMLNQYFRSGRGGRGGGSRPSGGFEKRPVAAVEEPKEGAAKEGAVKGQAVGGMVNTLRTIDKSDKTWN